MKLKFVGLFLVVITSLVYGETDYFMPVDAGSSAYAARMGHIGVFSPLSTAIFDNPASLQAVNAFSGSLFATTFMEEVSYQNLSVAARLPEGGVLAFGYMSAGVVGLAATRRDWNNNVVGDVGNVSDWFVVATGETFDYSNRLFKIAYSVTQNETWAWSIGATYYNTTVSTINGSGYNADLGVIANFEPMVFSITARNVIPGLGVTYSNGGKEKLPLQLAFGMQYTWDDFRLLTQLKASNGDNYAFLKSAAINYIPSYLPFFQASLGYREVALGRQAKGSFTAGVGLEYQGVQFDYAFETSDHVVYNAKHYFSLGFSF